MLVYKDLISGDELFSDSYPIKLIDDLYYEVEGKSIAINNDIDERLIGGNKAAEPTEGEDESVDPSIVMGINVILTHKLVETSFDKKSFLGWAKGYMKSLAEDIEKKHGAEKVKEFKEKMQKFVTHLVAKKADSPDNINLSDYSFYIGESMNPEGMVVLMGYRADQTTPYFIYFKAGLVEEKY